MVNCDERSRYYTHHSPPPARLLLPSSDHHRGSDSLDPLVLWYSDRLVISPVGQTIRLCPRAARLVILQYHHERRRKAEIRFGSRTTAATTSPNHPRPPAFSLPPAELALLIPLWVGTATIVTTPRNLDRRLPDERRRPSAPNPLELRSLAYPETAQLRTRPPFTTQHRIPPWRTSPPTRA